MSIYNLTLHMVVWTILLGGVSFLASYWVVER